MKRVQSFLLGLMMGTVVTDVLYVLIFGLLHEPNRFLKAWMNLIISLIFAFVSCDHPGKAIVKYTAIVGASQFLTGLFLLAEEETFNYKLNVWFFVYVAGILILSGFGYYTQKGLGYEKLCEEEVKPDTLLPQNGQH